MHIELSYVSNVNEKRKKKVMSKCTKTAVALAATVVTVFKMFSFKGHNEHIF